jgi:ankyrin repeat protein
MPVMTVLLDNGVDVDHANNAGQTALLIACEQGNRMAVKLLVEHGADVLATTNAGTAPIWYACAHNQKEIVELFLDHGASASHARPLGGDSAAAIGSYLEWVQTTSDVTRAESFSLDTSFSYGGETLLHLAAKKGYLNLVKLLIDRSAEINAQDEGGNTPLHYAAASGRKDVVKLLLEKGVDATITNAREQKAIDYSNIKGFNEITALILGASASP